MTFSSLISRTVPHNGKYSSRGGSGVNLVVQHHWAGTSGGDDTLINPAVEASVHYLIYTNGDIVGQVPEEFRAWTTGVAEVDNRAITIEVQDLSGQVNGNDDDPNSWKISDAAVASIARLIADVAKRHNFGQITDANYRGHREFRQTSCPGGYLWRKLPAIRTSANAILGGAKPVNPTPGTSGKTVNQLIDEVNAGKHGNGADRQASLGSRYNEVQAEINRRAGVSSAPAPAKPAVNIGALADATIAGKFGNGDARVKALGSNYNAVMAEVNRRLGAKPAVAKPAVNIGALADKTMRGDYGNGDQRKAALGVHYNAVQAEINRRYGG